jgi:hypothetical protein
MWSYFFILMGIFGIVIISLFSHILLSNEQNNFILKEVTEGAMHDAIDWKGFSEGLGWDDVTMASDPDSMHCSEAAGQVRILKEKFVESFVRRFAETVGLTKQYTITFYDIDECPPKVTVAVSSREDFSLLQFFKVSHESSGEDVKETISAILETKQYEEE